MGRCHAGETEFPLNHSKTTSRYGVATPRARRDAQCPTPRAVEYAARRWLRAITRNPSGGALYAAFVVAVAGGGVTTGMALRGVGINQSGNGWIADAVAATAAAGARNGATTQHRTVLRDGGDGEGVRAEASGKSADQVPDGHRSYPLGCRGRAVRAACIVLTNACEWCSASGQCRL